MDQELSGPKYRPIQGLNSAWRTRVQHRTRKNEIRRSWEAAAEHSSSCREFVHGRWETAGIGGGGYQWTCKGTSQGPSLRMAGYAHGDAAMCAGHPVGESLIRQYPGYRARPAGPDPRFCISRQRHQLRGKVCRVRTDQNKALFHRATFERQQS